MDGSGETCSSVISLDGVVAPQLYLQAASPIRDGASISGVAVIGTAIDDAYVDGMKKATGLESSIYGDTAISATTLVAPDGVSRLVGVQLARPDIKTSVLIHGSTYTGDVILANTAYFGAFMPLLDVDNTPVGMLFVGKPQIAVLTTAGASIELTFLVTLLCMLLSIIPAYVIAEFIARQIE